MKNLIVLPIPDTLQDIYIPISQRELEFQKRRLAADQPNHEFYQLSPDNRSGIAFWRIRKKTKKPNNLETLIVE